MVSQIFSGQNPFVYHKQCKLEYLLKCIHSILTKIFQVDVGKIPITQCDVTKLFSMFSNENFYKIIYKTQTLPIDRQIIVKT